MSQNKDLFAPPSKEELDEALFAAPTSSEMASVAPKAPPSKLESLGAGVQQGATLGLGDEFTGAVDAGLDATQSLLAKLGLTSPSPTDVNAKLASEGTKGDLGPKSTVEAYRAARDANRADNDAAAKANPWTYAAGNIAGGALTMPLLPGAATAPFGQAAAGAGLLTRAGMASANAIPMGAALGVTSGNADLTKGDLTGAAKDAGVGALTGAVVAPALTVGAAGLGALKDGAKWVGGKLIPKVAKTAFERGTEGIDTTGPAFYDDVHDRLNAAVNDVAQPITEKSQAQVKAHVDHMNDLQSQLDAAKLEQQRSIDSGKLVNSQKNELAQQKFTDDISDLDKQISQLEEQQQKAVELGKQKQTAQNADQIKAAQENATKVAVEAQQHVGEVQKTLGKAFDAIDAAADKTGVVPDSTDAIANFYDTIKNQSTLPEANVESIIKKLVPSMDGEAGVQDHKNIKLVLSKLFENGDPVVRRAAKAAYAQVKANYSKALQDAGYDELAARMAETNKKWSALANLQEDFIQNTKPDYVTGKVYPANKTLDSITKFGDQNAKQMGGSDRMTDLMKIADPEGAQPILGKIAGQADDVLAAKAAPSDVPVLPDPRIAKLQQKQALAKQGLGALNSADQSVPELPNPEITRLQELLNKARGVNPATGKLANPSRVEGVPLSTDSSSMKSELTNLLPKFGMQTGNDVADSSLDSIFNFLKNEKGEDFVNGLKSKLKPLNEDVALRNSQVGEEGVPALSLKGVASKLAGGASKVANAVGRGSKVVSDNVDKVQAFNQTGVKLLVDSSPETIQYLAEKLRSTGDKSAEGYAKVLTEAQGKNSVSKNAIMFGLMQQPKFREYFHKLENQESSSDEPVK